MPGSNERPNFTQPASSAGGTNEKQTFLPGGTSLPPQDSANAFAKPVKITTGSYENSVSDNSGAQSQASIIPYSPAAPSNWSGQPPAAIAAALDSLAATLTTTVAAATPRPQAGTVSARPAATGSGLLWMPTDLPVVYLDDPATKVWQQFVHGVYTPAPQPVSAYTIVSTTHLALAQVGDSIRATMLDGSNSKGEVALIASTALGATAAWIVNLAAMATPLPNSTYPSVGVCVTDGTVSGNSNAFGIIYWENGTSYGLHQVQWKVDGARSSVSGEYSGITLDVVRLRLLADGTNLHYQASFDGYHWADLQCAATPANLANYGFMVGNEFTVNSGWQQALILRNDLATPQQVAISSIAAGTPPTVTTSTPHPFITGDVVSHHGNTNAAFNTGTSIGAPTSNAEWGLIVNVLSPTTYQLLGATSVSAGTGGTATLLSR